jgi:hypothetical protein
MRAVFAKSLTRLQPADEAAVKFVAGLKLRELVAVEIARPRNLAHHRKFWKLMEIVAQNQEHYKSAEEVCAAFKVAVGHADFVQTKHGLVGIPRSISFAKCDQQEFDIFYSKAIDYLTTEVVPGVDKDALRAEVEGFL